MCRHFHHWSNNVNCNYDRSTYIHLCPFRCHRIRWRYYNGCSYCYTLMFGLCQFYLHIPHHLSFSRQIFQIFNGMKIEIFFSPWKIYAQIGIESPRARKNKTETDKKMYISNIKSIKLGEGTLFCTLRSLKSIWCVFELLTRALFENDWHRRYEWMLTEVPSTDRAPVQIFAKHFFFCFLFFVRVFFFFFSLARFDESVSVSVLSFDSFATGFFFAMQ